MVAHFANRLRCRALQSLRTWPNLAGWRDCFLVFALFSVFAIGTGFATQFFSWHLTAFHPLKFLGVMAILFVFPGIAEELVFRGLVLPHRSENWEPGKLRAALAVSVVVFVLWHVVNAWLMFPVARPVFWDWRFLLIVVGLGWTCGWTYLRTGSLWPPVLIHWSIVVIWKACLGGPVFFE
jgi:predicted Abi (CAAX) family protease